MKMAPTMEAMDDLKEIRTSGDLRRLASNALLALVRKEISATDVEAIAKGMEAISNSINTEIKLARLQEELRKTGGAISKTSELGRLAID